MSPDRLHLAAVAALALVLASGYLYISPGTRVEQLECRDCNVVLISVDTLRADHLGAYGYNRNTSPNIDRLARKGTVFENAVAQSSHTLTSHFSIFTGMYPRNHRVRPGKPDSAGFSDRFRMLAEVLNDSGYRTLAYTGGANVRGGLGFRRGFDTYRDRFVREMVRPEGNLESGVEFVGERVSRNSTPFFLFFHTYNVHDPYRPQERYMDLFEELNRSIRNRSNFRHRQIRERGKPDGYFRWRYLAPKMENSTEWRSHMVASYDADIRSTDRYIGRILDVLERKGLRDDTIVVVTSDHGEQFGEHGSWFHSFLHREELHVPLIIDFPGREGGRHSEFVGSVDLAPTLLEVLDVPARNFSSQLDGTSLLPVIEGERRPERYIAASHFTNQSMLLDSWKEVKYYSSSFYIEYNSSYIFERVDGFERLYRFGEGDWRRYGNDSLMQDMRQRDDLLHRGRLRKRLEDIGYVQ